MWRRARLAVAWRADESETSGPPGPLGNFSLLAPSRWCRMVMSGVTPRRVLQGRWGPPPRCRGGVESPVRALNGGEG